MGYFRQLIEHARVDAPGVQPRQALPFEQEPPLLAAQERAAAVEAPASRPQLPPRPAQSDEARLLHAATPPGAAPQEAALPQDVERTRAAKAAAEEGEAGEAAADQRERPARHAGVRQAHAAHAAPPSAPPDPPPAMPGERAAHPKGHGVPRAAAATPPAGAPLPLSETPPAAPAAGQVPPPPRLDAAVSQASALPVPAHPAEKEGEGTPRAERRANLIHAPAPPSRPSPHSSPRETPPLPTIEIHIGRIDVRAEAPQVSPRVPARPEPLLPLGAFLRNGGRS